MEYNYLKKAVETADEEIRLLKDNKQFKTSYFWIYNDEFKEYYLKNGSFVRDLKQSIADYRMEHSCSFSGKNTTFYEKKKAKFLSELLEAISLTDVHSFIQIDETLRKLDYERCSQQALNHRLRILVENNQIKKVSKTPRIYQKL